MDKEAHVIVQTSFFRNKKCMSLNSGSIVN